jgi:hypothetical protein
MDTATTDAFYIALSSNADQQVLPPSDPYEGWYYDFE